MENDKISTELSQYKRKHTLGKLKKKKKKKKLSSHLEKGEKHGKIIIMIIAIMKAGW